MSDFRVLGGGVEDALEFLDRDDLVLLVFDALNEFLFEFEGADEADDGLLVLLQVFEDRLRVVFRDVLRVLVGLLGRVGRRLLRRLRLARGREIWRARVRLRFENPVDLGR